MSIEAELEKRKIKAKKKIEAGIAELAKLRDECPHPGLTGNYNSNTGNWCPQDDAYWLELRCPLCEKYWTVQSTDPEYRTIKFTEFKS